MRSRILVGILLVIVLLILTSPSEENYYTWLKNEHGISCSDDESKQICLKVEGEQQKNIEWNSRHTQHVGVYTIYEDYYIDHEGNEIEIRGFGILNTFFKLKSK